jgi:uncharacterized membrane protein
LSAVGINASGQALFSVTDGRLTKDRSYLVTGTTSPRLKAFKQPFVQANGLNDSGVVAGDASANGDVPVAFEYTGKKSLNGAPPGCINSVAYFVGNDGTIGGTYTDASKVSHGFILQNGVYTTLDYPGAQFSSPVGISESGEIVGNYGVNGTGGGYVYVNSKFYTISVPGYTLTHINGVNSSGTIAGYAGPYTEPGWTLGFMAQCPAAQFPCTQ